MELFFLLLSLLLLLLLYCMTYPQFIQNGERQRTIESYPKIAFPCRMGVRFYDFVEFHGNEMKSYFPKNEIIP